MLNPSSLGERLRAELRAELRAGTLAFVRCMLKPLRFCAGGDVTSGTRVYRSALLAELVQRLDDDEEDDENPPDEYP